MVSQEPAWICCKTGDIYRLKNAIIRNRGKAGTGFSIKIVLKLRKENYHLLKQCPAVFRCIPGMERKNNCQSGCMPDSPMQILIASICNNIRMTDKNVTETGQVVSGTDKKATLSGTAGQTMAAKGHPVGFPALSSDRAFARSMILRRTLGSFICVKARISCTPSVLEQKSM